MLFLKNILLLLLVSPIFCIDLILFKVFKKDCSNISYQFMIRFFIISGGISNSLINKFIKIKKKINFDKSDFKIDNLKVNKNIINLNTNGYCIDENFLENKNTDKIINRLKDLKGIYSGANVKNNVLSKFELKKNLNSTRFTYSSKELLEIPSIQELLLSDEILKTAQDYLNSLPVIDIVTAWWTFPTKKSDKQAAQFWHFDMDRPKWVKVFIYLNEVNIDSGPHCFISRSHLDNGINYNIRKQGYSRIEDSEIEKYYSNNDIKYISGKKGTLLFEDTRGLHKGLRVNKNSRLILQFQYSSCLFGSKYKKMLFPKTQTSLFKKMMSANPQMFSAFE
mgnify:FL=1